jgi:hypothetical protein
MGPGPGAGLVVLYLNTVVGYRVEKIDWSSTHSRPFWMRLGLNKVAIEPCETRCGFKAKVESRSP